MRKKGLIALCAVATLAGCLDEDAAGGSGINAEGGGAANSELSGFFLGKGYAVFLSPTGEAQYATRWGLAGEFDFAAAAANDPKNAGRWRSRGDNITIDWGLPTTTNTWKGRVVSPTQLHIQSASKGPLNNYVTRPPKVSPSLVGKFKRGNFSYFGVDSTNTASGSVSGDHWVTFTDDGWVVVQDSVSVYLNGELLTSDKFLKGNFTIDGYTITITEENGKTWKKELWVSDGTTENPTLLAFDGTVYLRIGN